MLNYIYSKEPNRDFLCYIVNTNIPKLFKEFISERMREREKNFITKMNLIITCKPELAKMFMESKNVSVRKGRTHFLMRSVNRKRTRREMEEEYDKEKQHVREVQKLEFTLNAQRRD